MPCIPCVLQCAVDTIGDCNAFFIHKAMTANLNQLLVDVNIHAIADLVIGVIDLWYSNTCLVRGIDDRTGNRVIQFGFCSSGIG